MLTNKTIQTIEQLQFLRQQGPDGTRLTIGFTCSCFDLFHAGHVLMLKDAKDQCDILVVGLQSDPTLVVDEEYRIKTGGKQKNKPIQSYAERFITVSACKHIDYIVDYSSEKDLEYMLKLLRPEIRILGSDWEGKPFTGHEIADIKIHFHSRKHSYSTSNLRLRVYGAEQAKRNEDIDRLTIDYM